MPGLRNKPRLWSVFDAADYLGFHHVQIRKMVRAGRFPAEVVSLLPGSRVYRFDPEKLKQWAFHELDGSSLNSQAS